MGSAKAETMEATLRMFRSQYGDVESFLVGRTGLTKEDLEVIRRNLLVREGEEVDLDSRRIHTVPISTTSESESDSAASSNWASETEKDADEATSTLTSTKTMGFGNATKRTFEASGKSFRRPWGPCALVWLGCALGLAATGWAYTK